jgi:hypothetical protein
MGKWTRETCITRVIVADKLHGMVHGQWYSDNIKICCRLKAEGFSDEDVNRAMPYAIKGLGIATASVGGVGIVFSGIVYMSGVDIKQQAQVSSFKDAWAMLAGKNFGRALAGKVQAMMGVSEHKAVNPDHKAEGGQAEPK